MDRYKYYFDSMDGSMGAQCLEKTRGHSRAPDGLYVRAEDADKLIAALKLIADPPSDGCGCEHDDDDCCAKIKPPSSYHCPECIAHVALEAVGALR